MNDPPVAAAAGAEHITRKRSKTDVDCEENADTTAKMQRGKPFRRGQSGNPRGRPPGLRNKATLAAEVLLDGEAEALTRKAIEEAKGGNMIALRLCLDRIVPPRKDRPVIFQVPPLKTINDAPKAMGAIIGAVASGEISISEGADMSRMVESYVRAIEATDLEIRLRAIEERIKNASP